MRKEWIVNHGLLWGFVDFDGFVFIFFCTALGCWIVFATETCGRGSTIRIASRLFSHFQLFPLLGSVPLA